MAIRPLETATTYVQLPVEALSSLSDTEAQDLQFLVANPNLKVLIHFSAHKEADDLGDDTFFEVPIAKADIYAQENAGYKQDEAQLILDSFSKRRFGPEALPQALAFAGNSFEARQLKAIYDTGVVAIPADASSEHRLEHQEPSMKQLFAALAAPGITDATKETLINLIAESNEAREWVILADLGHKLSELVMSDPKLHEKLENGNLNVFMTYGSLHTGLFHKLKRLGLQPTRTFPHKPYVYSATHALIRQQMFNKS